MLCGTCGSRPMLSTPSAPRLLASCSPHAAGLASLMLPTSLLPEFSSPDFSLSLLPATLSTRSCFLGEPLAREALLRGTTAVVSRDHSSISGPETRFPERTAPVAVVLAKAPDVDLKSSPSSSIDLDAAMLANRIVITASSFAPQQIEQCASDFRGVDPASL